MQDGGYLGPVREQADVVMAPGAATGVGVPRLTVVIKENFSQTRV